MNIGGGEILLLALMALLLFGPKRLPEIGRQVGRAIAEVRKMSREFEREVRQSTDPFEKELRAAVGPIKKDVRQLEAKARKTYNVDRDFSSFRPIEEPQKPPQE